MKTKRSIFVQLHFIFSISSFFFLLSYFPRSSFLMEPPRHPPARRSLSSAFHAVAENHQSQAASLFLDSEFSFGSISPRSIAAIDLHRETMSSSPIFQLRREQEDQDSESIMATTIFQEDSLFHLPSRSWVFATPPRQIRTGPAPTPAAPARW